jgi:hypothetical protein
MKRLSGILTILSLLIVSFPSPGQPAVKDITILHVNGHTLLGEVLEKNAQR